MNSLTDMPADIDREQAFLLFATFTGDVERTSHALNVPAAAILQMAEQEGWTSKLGPILALKKSSKPGDVERSCNRALNFVQAHRMRLFVQRVITRITGMNETEFEEYLFVKSGKDETRKLTTRALADLASAMEKCQALTYAALNDTAPERAKRKEDGVDSDVSTGDLHAQISAGLAAVRASATPRAQLFDAQLAQAEELSKQARKGPASPLDDDNH